MPLEISIAEINHFNLIDFAVELTMDSGAIGTVGLLKKSGRKS
jgi:hypothetical protein